MKHNIIQMSATTSLTVPHSIKPIFQYMFDCFGSNPMNGIFDFVFQGLNRHRTKIRIKQSLFVGASASEL